MPPNFKTWITAVIIALTALVVMVAAQFLPYVRYLFGRTFVPVEFMEEVPVISVEPLASGSPSPSPKLLDPPPVKKPTNYSVYASPPVRPADSVKPGDVKTLFASVYGRQPSVSELRYWTGRIADKPVLKAFTGAMQFHLDYGIKH